MLVNQAQCATQSLYFYPPPVGFVGELRIGGKSYTSANFAELQLLLDSRYTPTTEADIHLSVMEGTTCVHITLLNMSLLL